MAKPKDVKGGASSDKEVGKKAKVKVEEMGPKGVVREVKADAKKLKKEKY